MQYFRGLVQDMNVYNIIKKFYEPGSFLYEILVSHSKLVADKALNAAKNVSHLNPDLDFIQEASMLHDIGVFLTYRPEIECRGKYRYIFHGLLGRDILEKLGLPAHALICERHVGMGMTAAEAAEQGFPPLKRDMLPVSLEEQIICYADKFFSKSSKKGGREEPIDDIIMELERYGPGKAEKFKEWAMIFENIQF